MLLLFLPPPPHRFRSVTVKFQFPQLARSAHAIMAIKRETIGNNGGGIVKGPIFSSPNLSKKDRMIGGDADKPHSWYTEYPLGGMHRKRMASYDSATALGLPQRMSNHAKVDSWEFPGFGSHFHMDVPQDQLHDISEEQERHHLQPKLSEWEATAICGNDILSSVLYVCGLVTSSSG